MTTNNQEAYETIDWILDNADMGFFIVTAPAHMQRKIAELYKIPKISVYDFLRKPEPYSCSDLGFWAESRKDAGAFFVLNMQEALRDESDMLSFNMSRDVLAKKKKIWLFFMTKDLERRLSTFAYDFYSFVRLKAHF
ncbi:MAG: hypothetical protein FWG53_05380 [Clostridiales bacterium]|nr:hypothetical protein [Clostridiales bacterium]